MNQGVPTMSRYVPLPGLTLWGKNVNNAHIATVLGTMPYSIVATYEAPRTYGVTLGPNSDPAGARDAGIPHAAPLCLS